MDITPQLGEDVQVVTAYGPGHFRINGRLYEQAVFISAAGEVIPLEINGPEALQADMLLPLVQKEQTEILIIGTGAQQTFLPPALQRALNAELMIGMEAMDTGAACRTFNVLTAESRRAAALLIPVQV